MKSKAHMNLGVEICEIWTAHSPDRQMKLEVFLMPNLSLFSRFLRAWHVVFLSAFYLHLLRMLRLVVAVQASDDWLCEPRSKTLFVPFLGSDGEWQRTVHFRSMAWIMFGFIFQPSQANSNSIAFAIFQKDSKGKANWASKQTKEGMTIRTLLFKKNQRTNKHGHAKSQSIKLKSWNWKPLNWLPSSFQVIIGSAEQWFRGTASTKSCFRSCAAASFAPTQNYMEWLDPASLTWASYGFIGHMAIKLYET